MVEYLREDIVNFNLGNNSKTKIKLNYVKLIKNWDWKGNWKEKEHWGN